MVGEEKELELVSVTVFYPSEQSDSCTSYLSFTNEHIGILLIHLITS